MKKIQLHNNICELSIVFSFIEELEKEYTLPPHIVFNLNLALEEAITNIIQYSNLPESDIIEIKVEKQDDILSIEILDNGIAFNPLEDAPPADITSNVEDRKIGGLGIYLIKNLMDVVSYARKGEQNVLIMNKKI